MCMYCGTCYVYLLWGKNALLYYYLAEIQKPRKQSRERRIGDRKILGHCRAQCPCTDVQVSARVPIVSLNNKDSSQADARQLATAEPTYMYTHLVCSNLRSIYNTTRMQHVLLYIHILRTIRGYSIKTSGLATRGCLNLCHTSKLCHDSESKLIKPNFIHALTHSETTCQKTSACSVSLPVQNFEIRGRLGQQHVFNFFFSCVQTDRCTRGISDTLKINYSGSILAKDHRSILLINL